MRNFMIALALVVATTSAAIAAEAPQGNSGRQAYATSYSAHRHSRHGKMYGSLAFTGVFTRQWTKDVPGVQHRILAGWGVMPEVNFTKHLGFQGDFISSYTTGAYPAVSKLSIMAGPRYTMNPYWKGTPFFFGEAGETRTGYGLYSAPHPGITWNPTASAGIGYDVKLTPRFALEFVPGEWMGERFDYSGQWQNNYMARVGFVFDLR